MLRPFRSLCELFNENQGFKLPGVNGLAIFRGGHNGCLGVESEFLGGEGGGGGSHGTRHASTWREYALRCVNRQVPQSESQAYAVA